MSGAYVPDSLLALLSPDRRVLLNIGECARVTWSRAGVLLKHPREFHGARGRIDVIDRSNDGGHVYRVIFDTPIAIDGAPLAFGSSWCAACELTPLGDDDKPIKPSLAWVW